MPYGPGWPRSGRPRPDQVRGRRGKRLLGHQHRGHRPAPGRADRSACRVGTRQPGDPLQLSWTAAAPPPATFGVLLRRYQEPRGTDTGSNEEQNITLSGSGTNAWQVRRKDNYDLENDATYYLEITAPGQDPVRAVYITSS